MPVLVVFMYDEVLHIAKSIYCCYEFHVEGLGVVVRWLTADWF